MYNKTEITGLCSELITKYYFDMDGAKHTWRHVFSVLQENEHIANKIFNSEKGGCTMRYNRYNTMQVNSTKAM